MLEESNLHLLDPSQNFDAQAVERKRAVQGFEKSPRKRRQQLHLQKGPESLPNLGTRPRDNSQPSKEFVRNNVSNDELLDQLPQIPTRARGKSMPIRVRNSPN
jgi:hypothetical protein